MGSQNGPDPCLQPRGNMHKVAPAEALPKQRTCIFMLLFRVVAATNAAKWKTAHAVESHCTYPLSLDTGGVPPAGDLGLLVYSDQLQSVHAASCR